MKRFYCTVSSLSSVSACGTTQRRPRIDGPAGAGSLPRMRSRPAVTGETHAIIRIVELLPAPLGPRKPNASPGRDVEVDSVDGGEVAEPLHEAAGMDERRGCAHAPTLAIC